MVKKIKNWIPTCNRFVAFLDIMGFRERVYRESHENVKRLLESLYPTIEKTEKIAKDWLAGKRLKIKVDNDVHFFPSPAVYPVLFSDSIILISSDRFMISINEMFSTVALILHEAINIEIPMKGAIAYGEMTADLNKHLYFGRPLIDAYELQSELQLYGVVLHHTCEKRINELKLITYFEDNNLLKYPIPMKSGEINHYIVNWINQSEKEKDLLNLISNLYNNVSGTPRIYVDNTIEFIREIQARKAELKKKKKS
jgi:hypothetical protein